MKFISLVLPILLMVCFSSASQAGEQAETSPNEHLLSEQVKSENQANVIVNINVASAEEIAAKLIGIGPSKAQAIVTFRQEHGLFSSVESLADVKGIGAATVNKNRERITL
ncbi:ComEA family DNA-binding protein [Vibrio viridaestus]|uniref:ComEA family DNA-binding protein n=1 Tax=Vibrio viridaestus TaxID=2487322 RepID=A0A3N9TH83_9VIBR|nr:ComEA family DNA-binding protein [Vibrio viridaestus]RQW63224.1 ComEA family DNA-binding protein [Vibrio viridaestus]